MYHFQVPLSIPQMDHPDDDDSHRVLNVHKNVPGVLRDVNRIISDLDANIKAQVRPPWPPARRVLPCCFV